MLASTPFLPTSLTHPFWHKLNHRAGFHILIPDQYLKYPSPFQKDSNFEFSLFDSPRVFLFPFLSFFFVPFVDIISTLRKNATFKQRRLLQHI